MMFGNFAAPRRFATPQKFAGANFYPPPQAAEGEDIFFALQKKQKRRRKKHHRFLSNARDKSRTAAAYLKLLL